MLRRPAQGRNNQLGGYSTDLQCSWITLAANLKQINILQLHFIFNFTLFVFIHFDYFNIVFFVIVVPPPIMGHFEFFESSISVVLATPLITLILFYLLSDYRHSLIVLGIIDLPPLSINPR